MNKPYWSGQGGRAGSSYVDDHDNAPTHKISSYGSGDYDSGYSSGYDSGSGSGFYSNGGYRSTDEYRASANRTNDEYDDEYDDYEYYERDTRWRWVAGLAVAVLLVAVLAITMVMRSDDTTPTAQSEAAPPATSTAPRTVIATIPPSPAAPPPAQLSPETVVTITTTPSTPPTPAAAPPPVAAPVAPEAAPPAPALDPRAVTYSVTGASQMIDFVSIIYTDEQGLPRTELNVALPWSKTLVLNPGVDFESVTATSVTGQLNCAITDAAGATVVAQNNNSLITTCTG